MCSGNGKGQNPVKIADLGLSWSLLDHKSGGGNDDLPQNSLKARVPRNSLIINSEVISHNHFPTIRPEKRFSPLISLHRTRVAGCSKNGYLGLFINNFESGFRTPVQFPKRESNCRPDSLLQPILFLEIPNPIFVSARFLYRLNNHLNGQPANLMT